MPVCTHADRGLQKKERKHSRSALSLPAADETWQLDLLALLLRHAGPGAGGRGLVPLAALRPAAATHGGVQQEGDVGEDGGDPHEGEHLDANVGGDVQLVLRRQRNLGSKADDRGNDGCDGDERASNGAQEGQGQTPPSRADDEGREEDHAQVDANTGDEEAVHDLGANLEEFQDGDGLLWQCDLGAGEQLTNQHFDGIEPEPLLWLGAKGDTSARRQKR